VTIASPPAARLAELTNTNGSLCRSNIELRGL